MRKLSQCVESKERVAEIDTSSTGAEVLNPQLSFLEKIIIDVSLE